MVGFESTVSSDPTSGGSCQHWQRESPDSARWGFQSMLSWSSMYLSLDNWRVWTLYFKLWCIAGDKGHDSSNMSTGANQVWGIWGMYNYCNETIQPDKNRYVVYPLWSLASRHSLSTRPGLQICKGLDGASKAVCLCSGRGVMKVDGEGEAFTLELGIRWGSNNGRGSACLQWSALCRCLYTFFLLMPGHLPNICNW